MNRTVRVFRVADIVRNHTDRRAAAMQFLEKRHDSFAIRGIEISGRLISKKNRWTAGQRSRYGHTLLLTSRKLRGKMPHPMRHSDPFERLLRSLFPVGYRHISIGERQ